MTSVVINMSEPSTSNWDKLKSVISMEKDVNTLWNVRIGALVSCNGRILSSQKTVLANLDCDY